jgi:hypothetical protein
MTSENDIKKRFDEQKAESPPKTRQSITLCAATTYEGWGFRVNVRNAVMGHFFCLVGNGAGRVEMAWDRRAAGGIVGTGGLVAAGILAEF